MNFTINLGFTYAIDPSGVIALACIAIVGIITYGAYRIQSTRTSNKERL